MAPRKSKPSSRLALILLSLAVVALTFAGGAAAEEIGCSFSAPVSLRTGGLVPEDAPAIPLPIGQPDAGVASCGDSFTCPDGCSVVVNFLFTGTGIVSGEVELIRRDLPSVTFETVARAECGPEVGVPAGACSGMLQAELPTATPGYLLACRATGLITLFVSGSCTGAKS